MSMTGEMDAMEGCVKAVAAALTRPTTLFADMGGGGFPQVYFGEVDSSSCLPVHGAGIDGDPNHPTWWVDFDAGMATEISDLEPDAPAATVAARIAGRATEWSIPVGE